MAYILTEDGGRLLQEDGTSGLLLEGTVPSRVSQAATLVLASSASPSSRVTQAMTLILVEDIPYARVTSAPLLVLADRTPCVQRWAQCWKITRADGVVLGFTTHDLPITFAGTEFSPCGSLNASALEMSAMLGESGNQDIVGLVSSDRITAADLAGGVYLGATVEVYLYPWSDAGGEIPIKVSAGIVASMTHGEASYKAETVSLGERLGEKSLLEFYTPTCRYTFGDARCGVDLVPLQHDGSVTAVVLPSTRINASARIFNDAAVVDADGYYDGGRIIWLTGANAGQTSEIKSYLSQQFVLWEPFLHPIQIGDTYRATPGCNLSKTDCKDRWSNYINFGGFPDIPGADVVLQTPDQKG